MGSFARSASYLIPRRSSSTSPARSGDSSETTSLPPLDVASPPPTTRGSSTQLSTIPASPAVEPTQSTQLDIKPPVEPSIAEEPSAQVVESPAPQEVPLPPESTPAASAEADPAQASASQPPAPERTLSDETVVDRKSDDRIEVIEQPPPGTQPDSSSTSIAEHAYPSSPPGLAEEHRASSYFDVGAHSTVPDPADSIALTGSNFDRRASISQSSRDTQDKPVERSVSKEEPPIVTAMPAPQPVYAAPSQAQPVMQNPWATRTISGKPSTTSMASSMAGMKMPEEPHADPAVRGYDHS